jgi:hypothetical protein
MVSFRRDDQRTTQTESNARALPVTQKPPKKRQRLRAKNKTFFLRVNWSRMSEVYCRFGRARVEGDFASTSISLRGSVHCTATARTPTETVNTARTRNAHGC